MIGTVALAEEEPQGVFFSRISQDFYAYWQSLARRRGGVPLRADLDPAEIPRLLPYVFIVEKVRESGRFFFRLSGTAIRDIMGAENTGRFLDELLRGEDLATVSRMFDQVLEQGVCIRSIEGLTYSDRSYLRVEILRLPLRAADGDQRLVLGCLSRVADDDRSDQTLGSIKDKQVIQIDNDVLPRKSF
jgi:hypothetical protein